MLRLECCSRPGKSLIGDANTAASLECCSRCRKFTDRAASFAARIECCSRRRKLLIGLRAWQRESSAFLGVEILCLSIESLPTDLCLLDLVRLIYKRVLVQAECRSGMSMSCNEPRWSRAGTQYVNTIDRAVAGIDPDFHITGVALPMSSMLVAKL